jgi:Flp pilus assembly protein TadG
MNERASNIWARHVRKFKRLLGDHSGVSAIEFAFLMPVLIALYLSSYELTTAYSASAKVLKAASTVADAVARQNTVSKTSLAEMIDAARATLSPDSTEGLGLKITGVSVDSAGNASVLWSWDQDGDAPYATGSAVDAPEDLKTPSSFLIRTEVSLPHEILLYMTSAGSFDRSTRSITLNREFYFKQRLGDEIPCGDCS